jgi:hypothetical protein
MTLLLFGHGAAAPGDVTIAATVLSHESDLFGVTRTVLVRGPESDPDAFTFITDGSNQPGPTAYIQDDLLTTPFKRTAAGVAYLAEFSVPVRGSLTIENLLPTDNMRAGSALDLTSSTTNATGSWTIASIQKRWLPGGRQTWTVGYGGLRPSALRANRRLTRAVRN